MASGATTTWCTRSADGGSGGGRPFLRAPRTGGGGFPAVPGTHEGLLYSIPGHMKGTFTPTYGVKVPFMR